MRPMVCGGVLVLALGCGPAIQENRLVLVPARGSDCSLQLISSEMSTWMSEWQIIGSIGLGDRGDRDPMSEETRAIVRPRACAMGGTAIALGLSSASSVGVGRGTGTAYWVLRPKPTQAEPPAPATF